MSGIDTYLEKIKSAIYGEEVRGAIYDSIAECYSNVSEGKTVADTAAESANAAATSANEAAIIARDSASEYIAISKDLDLITETSDNMWLNGDIEIEDSTAGYISFLLNKPLEAGTYTLSGIGICDNPAKSYSLFRFSTSQDVNYMTSGSFVGSAHLVHSGKRESETFVITNKVYTCRILSASTTSDSAGYGGIYKDIQIESGSAVTEYYPPVSAVDGISRKEFGKLSSIVDEMVSIDNRVVISDSVNGTYDDETGEWSGTEVYGVRKKKNGNNLKMWGTADSVSGTRRLVVFNGANSAKSTNSSFTRTIPAGLYIPHIKPVEGSKVSITTLRATYSTFANEFIIYDGEMIKLEKTTMLAVLQTAGVNYGDDEDSDYTEVSIEMRMIDPIGNDPYLEKDIKIPGDYSESRFAHQAFPDIAYFNGQLVVVSCVSASHYTPSDSSKWGGLEIDTISESGERTYIKTLTKANFPAQGSEFALEGEIRDCYIYPTLYGLLLVGWTTYYDVVEETVDTSNPKHHSFIALLNKNFNVTSYRVNPGNKTYSFSGKPLLTPTGHIIASCYRNGSIWVMRSVEAFTGKLYYDQNVEDPHSQFAFEYGRSVQEEVGESASNIEGSECSLGYNRNRLYLFARANTSGQSSCLYSTDDLECFPTYEGEKAKWKIFKSYVRDSDGANSIIHSPRLLSYSDGRYLVFAGANRRSASKRNSVIGCIDLDSGSNRLYLGVIDDNLNYGGYTGIQKYSGDEYDVVYYKEGSVIGTVDNPPTEEQALESGMYYKRVNIRTLIANVDIDAISTFAKDDGSYSDIVPVTWEQGNLSISSGETQNTKVIRTSGYLPNDVFYYIDYPDDYTITAYGYNYNNVSGEYDGVATFPINGHYLCARITSGSLSGSIPQYIRFKVSDGETVITPDFSSYIVIGRWSNKSGLPYVTPQMFGAVGDGVSDDTQAFQYAFYSGMDIHVPQSNHELYRITSTIFVDGPGTKRIFGDGINGTGFIIFDPQTDTSTVSDDRDKYLFRVLSTQAFTFYGLNVKSKAGVYDEKAKRVGGFLRANNDTCDYDIYIFSCKITGFYSFVLFKGRGFTVKNSSVTSSQYLGRFYWEDSEDTNVNHPAEYDQRAIILINNRFHSVQGGGFVVRSGHAYGLKMSDNVFDVGTGYVIHARDEVINWNISNNTFMGYNRTNRSVIHLANGGRNVIVNGNTFSADTNFWVNNPGNPNRWIEVEGSLLNSNICNNNFHNSIAEAIFVSSIEGCVVANNVIGNPYNDISNANSSVQEDHSDSDDDDTPYDDSDDDGQDGENIPDSEIHGSAFFVDVAASKVVINGNVALMDDGIVFAGKSENAEVEDAVFSGNYPSNEFTTLTGSN